MATNYKKAQKQLGKAIRQRRHEIGLSQEDFASSCGVHRTYMGAVERGERNISLMNIIRIANAFNIKPSELLAFAKF